MSIRTLLVDDHKMMRDGLRAILARCDDIEIIGEAGDGRAAVEMAERLLPNVVVMDIGMRVMNGVEATRQIRACNPAINVIALSTYSDRRYVLGILEAGASGYVLKAAAADEICRAIKVAAQGKHYLSPEIAGVVVDAQLRPPSEFSAPAPSALGPREREVLQLLAEGLTSSAIARGLFISPNTVDTHRRNIMKKLDVHNIAQLTKYAIREGLTPLED